MGWFNYIGLIIIVIIMIPNVIFAIKSRGEFNNSYKNRFAEVFEQAGRYGCMVLMIINIPYTYFGFWFDGALLAYIIINAALCVAYIVCWIVFWQETHLGKALTLSILPSCMFLFGGIMLSNIPLIVFASIFAPCHILISCKNAN